MIRNKVDYREHLKEDEHAIRLQKAELLVRLSNPIWRYEHAVRHHEYYHNCCPQIGRKPFSVIAALRHSHLSLEYGISIPNNVLGMGLNIAHIGKIIVNSHARVGDYCRLHACTNIGSATGKSDTAPTIVDRVYIG